MKSESLSAEPGNSKANARISTRAKALMIQGTTSDAGKSALCSGICRLLKRQGLRVAPFKPQNMALNSAVTVDGGEIGRAQAAQAYACGIEPHTDMNPVLLKPNTDTGAQVIINGRAVADMDARSYHGFKPEAMKAVLAAYERLAEQYDVIVIEGAGSPAEINLRDQDIANMGFAEAIDCPVLLVADIDRGGVFAHLVGTLQLLSPSEQQRIAGFVINKFRGDVALLQPGNDWLHDHTGKPVLAVLPYLSNLYLEAEDGLALAKQPRPTAEAGETLFKIAIPRLPRISNHTDFDPLSVLPGVELSFVKAGDPWPPADLIILPGSKSVGPDLQWLRAQGWEQPILRHLRYGGKLIGICGGLQMLGHSIDDRNGLEGQPQVYAGLGVMDYHTRLFPEKQLHRVQARLHLPGEPLATGYEIHAGITAGQALQQRPLASIETAGSANSAQPATRFDGAISADEQVLATYLHGIFDQPGACHAILRWAGYASQQPMPDYQQLREAGIERLANAVAQELGIETLLQLLNQTDAGICKAGEL